jgi:osmoprotectant transport system permease protein
MPSMIADLVTLAAQNRLHDRIVEHVYIASSALLLAVLVAIPAGIALSRIPRIATLVIGGTNMIMTIPSLALLALLMPLLGIGDRPAIVVLFLYGLMPILRNTYTGLRTIDPAVVEAGIGMGMTNLRLLVLVQLPMALAVILAGVRTTFVVLIGWATLAAFIGGGGLGQLIWGGLGTMNVDLILLGAIPAALLAIGCDMILGVVERGLIPRGLRLTRS